MNKILKYSGLLIGIITLFTLPIIIFLIWKKNLDKKNKKITENLKNNFLNIKERDNKITQYSQDVHKKLVKDIKPEDEWQCIMKNSTNSVIVKQLGNDMYCYSDNGIKCRETSTPTQCKFTIDNVVNINNRDTLNNQLKITPHICGDKVRRGWCSPKHLKQQRIAYLKKLNHY